MHRLRLPTLFTPHRQAAERALRHWLLTVALWLIDHLPPDAPLARDIRASLRKSLRAATQEVRLFILARALDRLVLPRRRPRRTRPHALPPGQRFQIARAPAHRRFARAGLKRSARTDLRFQIERLRAVLDDADAFARRLVRRLRRHLIRIRIVIARPPAQRLPAQPTPATATPDSS